MNSGFFGLLLLVFAPWRVVLDKTVQPKANAPDAFNSLRQILVRDDGSFVAVDGNPTQIRYYHADGTSNPIGRAGEGPGEYRQPSIALIGDTLIVHDSRLGRATVLRLNGSIIRTFLTPQVIVGPTVPVEKGGNFRLTVRKRGGNPGELSALQWLRMSLDGKLIDSMTAPILVAERTWDLKTESGNSFSLVQTGIPLSPLTEYAFLPNGNLIYGRTDRDEFIVTRTGRDTVMKFGHPGAKPIPTTSAERSLLFKNAIGDNEKMLKVARESDIPATHPLWTLLRTDLRGNLWVERYSASTKESARFDIYDIKGVYQGEVTAPFPPQWRRLTLAGDRVAMWDMGEDDEQRVKVYRILR